MKNIRFFLCAFFYVALSHIAYASNVENASAPDPDDKPLDLRIWYPSDAAAPTVVKGAHLPLIVISHGAGGSKDGHDDTAHALADAGFVVVAVEHTGDNYRDQSYVRIGKGLIDRPRHIVRVIDYMLAEWHAHQQIDPARVGMFGHSAGGFTALVLAGGQPDLTRTADYCRRHPQAWTCVYLKKNGVAIESIKPPPVTVWLHDPRIKAASVSAPAVGYAFEPEGLTAVRIPVQLWVAERDEIVADSPAMVRRLLPALPEYHLVNGAGHFSFLTPCAWQLRGIVAVMRLFGTEAICTDPDGFDRTRFHQNFNAEVVRFFSKALGAGSGL